MSARGPGQATETLAHLLAAQAAAKRSGILTASRGKLKRLFCIERGQIVFAASNVIEEQFGERLVSAGLLSASDLAAAVREAQRQGVKLPRVLAEHDVIADDVLRTTMEEQIRELLASCLEWPKGEFHFEPGQPSLQGEATGSVSIGRAILEYARCHPESIDAVRMRLGRLDRRFAVNEQSAVDSGDLDDAGRYLLQACHGDRTAAEALHASPADEQPTLRALYGLLLAGGLTPAGAAGGVAMTAGSGKITRAEIEKHLRKPDDCDHYKLLGVEPTASRDQIRNAYYRLARGMHPDRFRVGDMTDLFERVEQFFTRVTEAYNTLFDPELRQTYDELLAGGTREAAASTQDKKYLARQNYLRGKELVERRRYNEALQFLENAVNLDPTQADYFLGLGLLLSRNPRMRAEAEQRLRKVTELEPTATDAYLALGGLYRRAGRRDEAEQMYREVLRWQPDSVAAQGALAELAAGATKSRRG